MNDTHSMHTPDLLTVIMPVRIDCKEREDNLRVVLQFVCGLGLKVILLEADARPVVKDADWMKAEWTENLEYKYAHDESPIFHRTKYINELLNGVGTDVAVVWDADVLVPREQIEEALKLILEGATIAYPYNGEFVMLSESLSTTMRQALDLELLRSKQLSPIFGRKFCGGIYLVHRDRYLHCGGENEHFKGWGPEDAERLRRVQILGQQASWIKEGEAYHLYHPRGKNSNFYSDEYALRMRKELIKICSMDKEELNKYILSWKKQ